MVYERQPRHRTAFVSRPKIHRLPRPCRSRPKKASKSVTPGFPLFWAAIFLAFVGISMIHQPAATAGLQRRHDVHRRLLPAISVSAQDGSASRAIIPDADASTGRRPAEKQGKPSSLQGDKSDAIVGQMARIPAENEQITEIKSVSDIDKDSGRELLSIISKY